MRSIYVLCLRGIWPGKVLHRFEVFRFLSFDALLHTARKWPDTLTKSCRICWKTFKVWPFWGIMHYKVKWSHGVFFFFAERQMFRIPGKCNSRSYNSHLFVRIIAKFDKLNFKQKTFGFVIISGGKEVN